ASVAAVVSKATNSTPTRISCRPGAQAIASTVGGGPSVHPAEASIAKIADRYTAGVDADGHFRVAPCAPRLVCPRIVKPPSTGKNDLRPWVPAPTAPLRPRAHSSRSIIVRLLLSVAGCGATRVGAAVASRAPVVQNPASAMTPVAAGSARRP